MASSSTRSTHLERHLTHVYKIAYCRLYHSNMLQEAHALTNEFAKTLDISAKTLLSTLNPRHDAYNPDDWVRQSAKQATKLWEDLATESRKRTQVERVWSAGNCLAEIGACLFAVGREKEARSWCEMGEFLHDAATYIAREEELKRPVGVETIVISDDEP